MTNPHSPTPSKEQEPSLGLSLSLNLSGDRIRVLFASGHHIDLRPNAAGMEKLFGILTARRDRENQRGGFKAPAVATPAEPSQAMIDTWLTTNSPTRIPEGVTAKSAKAQAKRDAAQEAKWAEEIEAFDLTGLEDVNITLDITKFAKRSK